VRVLFFGDLAATGFGSVTTDLGKEMLALGIDVRFVSQNDTGQPLPEPFRSRTANLLSLLASFDKLTGEELGVVANQLIGKLVAGTAAVKLHSGEDWGDWVPEAAILLGDYRAAQFMVDRAVTEFASIPTIHYVPIEGTDLPPDWMRLWSIIKPVAMSRFGARQIEKIGGKPVPMVYHGIDTTVFRPIETKPVVLTDMAGNLVPLTSREDAKRAWAPYLAKVNDLDRVPRKWLLRTDRNMPRKQYGRLLRSLAPVLERNTSWALVIHCTVFDQGGYLADSASKYPTVRNRILFTDADPTKPMDRESLVSLYNAADLYVSNSAEGFGLTIAESLACGTPAVGVRYSAVPEVIGPAGVVVDKYRQIDNEYDHFWCAVDEEAFGAAVEDLMIHDARRLALGAKGPRHVASSFSWATAAKSFSAILEAEVSTWRSQLASRLSASTSAPQLPPDSSETDRSAPTSSSPLPASIASPDASSIASSPPRRRSRPAAGRRSRSRT
jgi:glycosyltransferase involved in cell wall biosynthesis